MYRTVCPTCGIAYDAVKAADCNCLSPTRSVFCPHCGNCFCSAPREFNDRFWADAPRELWDRRRRRVLAAAGEPPESIDPTRQIVLFADDDPTGRRIAQEVIREMGYTVLVARDGDELLERARQVRPELVITDALMPRRDGRETARLIRDEMPGTRIVIITSVYKDPRYKHEAFRDFGVDEYLTKPVAAATLREVVQRLMPSRGATA